MIIEAFVILSRGIVIFEPRVLDGRQ